MTEIISLGLPPIGSVSIAAQEVSGVSTFKGSLETRAININVLEHKEHAILVSFLKAVDEGAELDCQWGSLLIQPLSSRQCRIAKRRGWTKLVTSHLEGHTSPSITCYYLKVCIDRSRSLGTAVCSYSHSERAGQIAWYYLPDPTQLDSWGDSPITCPLLIWLSREPMIHALTMAVSHVALQCRT